MIEQTEKEIKEECDKLAAFLIEKNRQYGDSALNPKRFFAKGDPVELIHARIDDKLNRIFQGEKMGEDPLKDLSGYYILLQVARKRKREADGLYLGGTVASERIPTVPHPIIDKDFSITNPEEMEGKKMEWPPRKLRNLPDAEL